MVWIMTDQDMVNRNSNEMLLTDARITWGWKIEYALYDCYFSMDSR